MYAPSQPRIRLMVSLPHLTMIPSSEESRIYCTPLAISALAASDLVPWTVRLGYFPYLPVTGSLPKLTETRHLLRPSC